MHFAPYVLAALSATAAGVQAAGDPPDYGKKPDYPSYPDYGKKPDYPDHDKKPYYPKKPDCHDDHHDCHKDYPDYDKKPDCHDDHDDCHKDHHDYDKKPEYHHKGYGHAKVVNFCPYDVYLWSVAWDTDGPYKIGCRQEYVEKYLEGGVALEIVKDKHHWYHDDDKLILYYKKDYGKVHYDLYDKYGHPFEGHKVVLEPEEHYCPAEYWDDGCDIEDGGKKTCDDFADLVLYLCKEYEHDYHKPKYPKHPKYPPYPPKYPPKYPDYPKYPDPPKYPGYPPPQPPPVVPPPVAPPAPAPVPGDPAPVPGLPPLPVPVPGLPPLPVPVPGLPPLPVPVPGLPPLPVPVPGLPTPPIRRHIKARAAEGNEDEAWHTRQWENDKPAWDTDPKCTDCGAREPGVVVDIPADGPVKA